MSDVIKFTGNKANEFHSGTNYKTILNSRDISESKSFSKQKERPSIGNDKALLSQQNFLLEKRISKMTNLKSNSRSSSAIRNKRGSQGTFMKKAPGLKFKNLLTPTNDLINTLLFK